MRYVPAERVPALDAAYEQAQLAEREFWAVEERRLLEEDDRVDDQFLADLRAPTRPGEPTPGRSRTWQRPGEEWA